MQFIIFKTNIFESNFQNNHFQNQIPSDKGKGYTLLHSFPTTYSSWCVSVIYFVCLHCFVIVIVVASVLLLTLALPSYYYSCFSQWFSPHFIFKRNILTMGIYPVSFIERWWRWWWLVPKRYLERVQEHRFDNGGISSKLSQLMPRNVFRFVVLQCFLALLLLLLY